MHSPPRSLEEFRAVYDLPFHELLYQAQTIHRRYHDPGDIQRCALLSIKTGGCPEDCHYCTQSAHYETDVTSQPLLSVEEVAERARRAKEQGASRFCMGAAWRSVPDDARFEAVLEMVRAVRDLDMEACVTLGMLTDEQAKRLADAGLTAYNHNLDTSRDYYPKIVSTRTYDERLATIRSVARAGISVCCGAILGMGESIEDRLMLLVELAALATPPESIPLNCLIPMPGTPLADAPPADSLELARLVATTRIGFPHSRVRLSAGRRPMSRETQVLCFLAGANSIFLGETLLTAPNPAESEDEALFAALGIGERVSECASGRAGEATH